MSPSPEAAADPVAGNAAATDPVACAPASEAPDLIRHEAPSDPAALRAAIYAGAVFQLAPTEASLRLCAAVNHLLDERLGDGGPPRQAQFRLSAEDFFARVGQLRQIFFTTPPYHEALRAVLAGCGFDPADNAFDPLRLRVIPHRGFEEPRAAPVYYAHRDTWYAHPQGLITWWIPLHDVAEEETFFFYPAWFQQAVPNSSETFDYNDWVRDGWELKIGWQRRDAGLVAHYPGPTAEVPRGPTVPLRARAGEVVLFSGAHFHQTRPNTTGQTRFSLDFRTVHLPDHERGRGAPNVDARARGSALRDYVRPA